MKYEVEIPDGKFCNFPNQCPFYHEGECRLLDTETHTFFITWDMPKREELIKKFGTFRPQLKNDNCPVILKKKEEE